VIERHTVTLATGEHVGWVGYHTVSDIWFEHVEATADEAVWGEHRHCTNPPDVDGTPHKFVLAHTAYRGETCLNFLYCQTCRCLVTPPHDGYAYLDYPTDWLAMARETL
jgi:hypothetical protein